MREEEKKHTSQKSSVQKFFKKRWVFPAVYLASAAIIITAILWYQASGNDVAEENQYGFDQPTDNEFDNPALEVNRSLENFVMPLENPDKAVIEKQFYDVNASAEEQAAALVVYNNSYQPNQGIDISMDGKEFDVQASMSGTVTKVLEDELLGNVIEIEHDKGIVTLYQSVKDFKVKEGDTVKQGQSIAKAGQSTLNKDAGVHVHFEIRKDDVAVNPLDYVNKSLATLQEASLEEEQKVDQEEQAGEESTEQPPSEENAGTESPDSEQPAGEESTDPTEDQENPDANETEEQADPSSDESDDQATENPEDEKKENQ
ncbi:stage II sporulation protein Q [Bacillus pakistanensis]|uniref:Stage II sporulation protein Q n=2 Tax=Rossellomorea pakistanensis TaxID=992288 RepID=A0ABS2NBS0_9BACI|nr:stage II sporulation protein Q [Bacillus pakistanensis]